MTEKLNEITPEQTAAIEKGRTDWLENGASLRQNNPCNREALHRVMEELFKRQGKARPKLYWADSPFAACLAAPLLVRKGLPDPETIGDIRTVSAREGAADLLANLKNIQRKLVTQILGPDVAITQELLTDWQKGSQMSINCRWSGWWCGYMVHCHMLNKTGILQLENEVREHLDLWVELYRHLHIMFVFEDFIIFSERPTVLSRNDNNRLHSTKDAALQYTDGYALFVVNGARVPEKAVVAPEQYTYEELQEIDNSEVHRIIAENLGWDKYIEKIRATVVDRFFDERTNLEYELLESSLEVAGDLQPKYLRMRSPKLFDGSNPWFIEPVDPGLKTAQAARKWQVQLSKEPGAKYFRQGDVVLCTGAPESMYWPSVEECNENPVLNFEIET